MSKKVWLTVKLAKARKLLWRTYHCVPVPWSGNFALLNSLGCSVSHHPTPKKLIQSCSRCPTEHSTKFSLAGIFLLLFITEEPRQAVLSPFTVRERLNVSLRALGSRSLLCGYRFGASLLLPRLDNHHHENSTCNNGPKHEYVYVVSFTKSM